MARAYTPGLTVAASVTHRSRRILPVSGDVLKQVGDAVEAQDIVAQTFMPGNVTPLKMASLLSVSSDDVPGCMLVKVGDRVTAGEPIARTKGIFGYFKSEYRAKVSGILESVSPVTGQVLIRAEPIPVQVRAYLKGKVVEILPKEGIVVEADVTLIQGIFGVGGEAYGPIHPVCSKPDQQLTPDLIQPDMRGKVIIGGSRVTAEAIKKAVQIQAAALVTGGIDDQDLRDFLGYDLGVAVTGSEKLGLTLIITEGFGDIAMAERTFQLLKSRSGDAAAVNGATQIRAGVMRPEIVIPLTKQKATTEGDQRLSGELAEGVPVRIIRDPYFGLLGTVAALPSEPQVLPSGSKARVLEVGLNSGKNVIVPRANVELIEG